MGSRVKPNRIQCINCNICINTLRKYPALELDTRVTSVISNWVYPRIITEDDYVCEACRDLAIVNDNVKQEVADDDCQQAGPIHKGHSKVCLLCGCSTLRRQSNKILRDNPSEMQQAIFNILQNRLAHQHRQITESDSVCIPCWLRLKREVSRINRIATSLLNVRDGSPEEYQPLPSPSTPDPLAPNPPNNLADVKKIILPSPSTPDPLAPNPPNNLADVKKIFLPNYKRAANSSRRCVFRKCKSTTRHTISDKLRAIVLSNHKYYLPDKARVCTEHLMSNSWDTLFDSENSIQTFTVEQIQHVFSFVNAFNPTLDFENFEEMDDRVFEYCTGVTKEKFNNLLEQVPQIKEMKRGSLGLAALLIKKRRGDPNTKISTLVQMPRRTLESLMEKVRAVLCQEFITENL